MKCILLVAGHTTRLEAEIAEAARTTGDFADMLSEWGWSCCGLVVLRAVMLAAAGRDLSTAAVEMGAEMSWRILHSLGLAGDRGENGEGF